MLRRQTRASLIFARVRSTLKTRPSKWSGHPNDFLSKGKIMTSLISHPKRVNIVNDLDVCRKAPNFGRWLEVDLEGYRKEIYFKIFFAWDGKFQKLKTTRWQVSFKWRSLNNKGQATHGYLIILCIFNFFLILFFKLYRALFSCFKVVLGF